MDCYEVIRCIGSGSSGDTKLVRDKRSGEFFAAKYIMRGEKIDVNVERGIMNFKILKHPNMVRFKEIFLTPTHLAIVMEYAEMGELYKYIVENRRFSEDRARYFFQQLISGLHYLHSMRICHRNIKASKCLLDESRAPCLKICDFGLSKSSLFHSEAHSRVGTIEYMAPEVRYFTYQRVYDGKIADIWSSGVMFFAMLVGSFPFVGRIQHLSEIAMIPEDVNLSWECRHILSRMLEKEPQKRITMSEIKNHPWYLHNLPIELRQLWLNSYPLDRNLVFDYFALSPFYDWTCNNEQIRMQSIHPLDESHLSKMTGIEYMLHEVMEPHLFVIRKQKRDSPEKVTPMLTYYVLDGSIYQAPQLCNVFAARVGRAIYHITKAFTTAASKLEKIGFVDGEAENAAVEPKVVKEPIDFKELKRIDHILASIQRKHQPAPPPPPFPEGYNPPTAEADKDSENQQAAEPEQPLDPIISQGPPKRMKY